MIEYLSRLMSCVSCGCSVCKFASSHPHSAHQRNKVVVHLTRSKKICIKSLLGNDFIGRHDVKLVIKLWGILVQIGITYVHIS
jgi:hypothetical protein